MNERLERIWKLASKYRGHAATDFKTFIEEARARGVSLRHSDLRILATRFPSREFAEFYIPEVLVKFVAEYMSKEVGLRILDPCAGMGGFIDELAISLQAEEAIAVTPIQQLFELGRLISGFSDMRWESGDPLMVLEAIDGQFDVVVSCPPFNWGPKEVIELNNGKKIKIKDYRSNLVVLKSAMLLDEKGIGFYVVPNSFFFKSGRYLVRDALSELGLHIDAVFSLPAGTFSPSTSIAANLIAIKRQKFDQLFVAELNPDADFKPILKNWRKRKESRTLSLGVLVDPVSFTSYHALSSQREMERLASSMGLKPFSLKKLALEMNLENKKIENGFEEKPNSLYLPTIGQSDALTQLSALNLKPQNYVQIVLEPNKVLPSYLASFLNTKLGRLVRESVTSGGVIGKISKSTLSKTVDPPPLEMQAELVDIQSEIIDLSGQLESFENTLWEKPFQFQNIRKALKSINRETGLEEWLETLPFPLASILRRYHADHKSSKKNEHLLHFFEGFSQFLATIMLSGLTNNKELFERKRDLWVKTKLADKLKMSSFGTWLRLGEEIAKLIRRELSSKKDRERCLRMFRLKRPDFLDTIVDKRIFEILSTTKEYRDLWKGHGGIVGGKEEKRRKTLLENELAMLRRIISDCFEDFLMFRPKSSKYSEGIYTSVVISLMGSHTTFKEEEVQTIIPLDINNLYFVEADHLEPLDILPFVRLMPSPISEENACYFYNRMVKEEIRWVSYHFEKESDVTCEDKAIKAFISQLESKDVSSL